MKRITHVFALMIMALSGMLANAQPTLTPDDLKHLLEQPEVRIIDIRPPADFAKGHIAKSSSAPYAAWRGPAHSPGTLPPLEKLTQLVRQLGIDEHTHNVVVYAGKDATDFGAAARVYWTLKYLGLENLSILNGGLKAWQTAGFPLTTETAEIAPSAYSPRLNQNIIATQSDILRQIDAPNARLVDARPENFFQGQVKAPTAAVPGTIRSAVNLPHSQWFKPGTSEIVSAEEARKIAAQTFPELVDDTITFCNTGHWAATDWFALSELAGLPNIRMYPESLADWTNADEPLPMSNEPGRAAQISNKLKSLLN